MAHVEVAVESIQIQFNGYPEAKPKLIALNDGICTSSPLQGIDEILRWWCIVPFEIY
jgi:hypothetical protein